METISWIFYINSIYSRQSSTDLCFDFQKSPNQEGLKVKPTKEIIVYHIINLNRINQSVFKMLVREMYTNKFKCNGTEGKKKETKNNAQMNK